MSDSGSPATAGETAARPGMEPSGNRGGALPLVVRTRSRLEVGADYCFDRRVSTEAAGTNVRGAAGLGAKRTSRDDETPTLAGATEQHARTIFREARRRAPRWSPAVARRPGCRRAAHRQSPRRRRPRLGWAVGAVAAHHVPLDQGANVEPISDLPRTPRPQLSLPVAGAPSSRATASPLRARHHFRGVADPDRRSSEPVPWSARHAVVAARGPVARLPHPHDLAGAGQLPRVRPTTPP